MNGCSMHARDKTRGEALGPSRDIRGSRFDGIRGRSGVDRYSGMRERTVWYSQSNGKGSKNKSANGEGKDQERKQKHIHPTRLDARKKYSLVRVLERVMTISFVLGSIICSPFTSSVVIAGESDKNIWHRASVLCAPSKSGPRRTGIRARDEPDARGPEPDEHLGIVDPFPNEDFEAIRACWNIRDFGGRDRGQKIDDRVSLRSDEVRDGDDKTLYSKS